MSITDAQQPMRLLIISHDIIGSRMAGPGIRYWEMAHTLAAQQPVTLIAPHPIDVQPAACTCGTYTWGDAPSLHAWLNTADTVLANGFVLHAHPELIALAQPLVLDLYDPTMLENLVLFRHTPLEQRLHQSQQDMRLLNQQLQAGDFFLCATERQRDLYIGSLMANGRITPAWVDNDPDLRNLIDVVPSGVPVTPPAKTQPALRQVLPAIGPDDALLLWTGGLWDWMDPLTLVEVMPTVVASFPDIRLVFLAGQHPGNSHPMDMPARARARATELGLLDHHIFFYDRWVPYQQRANFLLEANIAISLHRDQLETRYAAIRSRIMDHLWAQLPSIVSRGDPASEVLEAAGAALTIPPGDTTKLTEALLRLLSDTTLRESQAQAAQELATRFAWRHVIEPLARFCLHPRKSRDTHDETGPEAATPATAPAADMTASEARPPVVEAASLGQEAVLEACRNAAITVQEQQWWIEERPVERGRLTRIHNFLVNQIVRPFVVPLIEQQRDYNVAVLRSMYAMNEAADQRRSSMHQRLSELKGDMLRVESSIRSAYEHIEHIENRMQGHQEHLNHLNEYLHNLHTYIQTVESHSAEVGIRTLKLQEHIARLRENNRMTRQQLYDFVEQLAGLEDTDSQLIALLRGLDHVPPIAAYHEPQPPREPAPLLPAEALPTMTTETAPDRSNE